MKTVCNTEDWTTALTGEYLLLGLLGKMLYTAPRRDWLSDLIHGDLFTEAPFGEDQPLVQRGMEEMRLWCQENQAGIAERILEDLQEDYLRLFIGVEHVLAPVWESVYFSKDRLIFQEETLQVRQWYARYGAEIEQLHKEPDDHIGLELIFVAHLAQVALDKLAKADNEGFQSALTAQSQFLDEHPLRFAPAWYKLVQKHAATDFYRALADLIWGALQAVANLLMIELASSSSK